MRTNLVILICVLFLSVGCSKSKKEITTDSIDELMTELHEPKIMKLPINTRIVIMDSCEYLRTIHSPYSVTDTHKGNCKYCEERKIKLYEKLLSK